VIEGSKRQAVLDALAEAVFKVPRGQVQMRLVCAALRVAAAG
jgi:hypothetical protein